MLTANNISKYLLHLTNPKIEDDMSNLKLQKMLYYLQGFHLAIYDERIFSDEIECWTFGPVVVDTYHSYKNYGHNTIVIPIENEDFQNIPERTKKFISRVYSHYRQYSAIKLMNMTHENGTPWNICNNAETQFIITDQSMKEHFKSQALIEEFVEKDKETEMKNAAALLMPDYLFDKKLTESSCLETEDFYES